MEQFKLRETSLLNDVERLRQQLEHENKDHSEILNVLVDIRKVVLDDPDYDKHLCEMVSNPLSCALVIKDFVNDKLKQLEALKGQLEDACEYLSRSCALLCNVDQKWSPADIEIGLDKTFVDSSRVTNNEIAEFLASLNKAEK